MPVQIDVIDSEVQPMVEFYGHKLQAVREQRKALEAEEKRYESIISKLLRKPEKEKEVEQLPELATGNGYSPKWAIHEKITYVLTASKKPLTTREIIDQLRILEPALNADKTKTDKNISTVLSIKNGELYDRKQDGTEYKYFMKKKIATA